MPRSKAVGGDENSKPKRRPPATTPEARENQLISLAVELAETQLIEGTASAQVITHFLKLGTTREELEKEKLRRENNFLEAKSNALASSGHMEELYQKAILSMRKYSGHANDGDEDE